MSQPYYFKNYQVGDGVSSNTITAILQDKKGFMWFGTRSGLNRFDGNTFRIFNKEKNDAGSIGSNSILSLFEDSRQQLWIGTYQGIYIYNPLLENFTFFNKIPNGEVRYIARDSRNYIWIVCDFSLYCVDEKSGAVKSYDIDKGDVIALGTSPTGALWIGTGAGMIKKYDVAADDFKPVGDVNSNNGKQPSRLQDIYAVDDSSLIVGTMSGAFWLNTKTQATKNIFGGNRWPGNIQIHKIVRHSASEYWLGTEIGLFVYNASTENLHLIQKEYGNPYSITDNVIYSFCQDTEGGIWTGTFFGGINYYSKQLNAFQKYFPQKETNSISGNLVHEICADQNGNIWIGTEDAGLNKLDTKTGIIKHFAPGKGKGSIAYQNIHGLLADGNELWIGTYEHGLDVMDLRTEKVVRHYERDGLPGSLGGNFIVSIYKTKNSEVLIGTWNGLFVYNRERDTFLPHPFFNMQVQAMHEDKDGILWLCSYGNGVFYYNPKTHTGGSLWKDAEKKGLQANNYVNNLFEDSKRNLWFCTEGGLYKYDYVKKDIVLYNDEKGLPVNQVFKVQEDRQHNLWVSTSKGLVMLDTKNGRQLTYTMANGLLSEQFNYNSAYTDTAGKMYFGSVKGMVSFQPSQLRASGFVPPVYITGIQINNRDLYPAEGGRLRSSVVYTNEITLPYDSSTLSLDVAALSYTTSQMNHYAYKMDGLDKDWIYIKSNRRIFYTKLPPGNYTFRIKGNAGDVWNDKETTLQIKVLPPFWASTGAYIFYSAIIIAIGLVVFRYYHMAVKEKNKRRYEALEIEKEREVYNAKIEFFTNIAHEIRTPLTLIKLPLDKMIDASPNSAFVTESLSMMKKNTNRLIDLTDQLLDFRKAEANKFSLNFIRTDITGLLKEIFISFKPAAEEKRLSVKMELPRMELHAWVDTEAFRKILTNLSNNAIKYASTAVAVRLYPFNSDDKVFKIEVRNDGYLIPYALKEKIFEPFYRLKETEKQAGTGIGLALSRSLAELHKGVLDLQQPDGGFNVFFLSIPIHQENEIHLQEYETISFDTAVQVNDEVKTIADPNKLSLLLVEDNHEILNFISKELQQHYSVYTAFNGEDALDILEKENIHLVVSDIMMPVMDGIELCRKIKTDLRYSHIPIVLLTAKNTLNSKIEGLEVGADAYIEKPFAFEHLQAQINNLLANRNIIKEHFANSPLALIKGMASNKLDTNFLEQLHQIIVDNITDMDLDVDKLSRMMNMSRTSFYRKIKGLSNLTPNELINISRLKKAAELLASGDYKINEVATMVGYTVNSNFSRDFHKQFGVTPSAYASSAIS